MTHPDPDPTDEPVWPSLAEWIGEAGNLVEIVPADADAGEAALESLDGVTDGSALGAIVRNTAGIVVDDWLLLLGAGDADLPGIRDLNGRAPGAIAAIPGALVVAVDKLGGGFAVNAGGLPEGEVGEVCYLAPDDLEWMACGFGHPALIEWAFEGDVDGFYEDLRWATWREEATALGTGKGFNAYPPPWSDEAEDSAVSRAAVPLAEAWGVVLATSLARGTWSLAGTE
ncbi:MAG: DUF2625 family protein [Solirubrobacteraceae bacterium]|nr:DUF2625 family protein [Patulibacter sp.]